MIDRRARAGARLLRTPAPQPDESLMGYLLRLAEANHYDSPQWILDLAGLKLSSANENWRRLCEPWTDFTLFRQVTGLTEQEIEKLQHSIVSEEEYYHSGIAHQAVPSNAIRFNHPKVCPDCLRESNYCRKLWDLLAITVCPRHQVLLVDKCPDCKRRMTWSRKSLSFCRCGYEWRNTQTPRLEKSESRAMQWLMRAAVFTSPQNVSFGEEESPMRRLSFGDLSLVLLSLAEFLPVRETTLRLHSGLENHLCHEALEQAVGVMDNWPTSFHRFCEENLTQMSRPDLASHLNRLAQRDALVFLRVALEEYLEETSQFANPPINALIERRFLPPDTARERLELSRRGFETLVATGRLRMTNSVNDPHTLLIDEMSIRRLLDERKWMPTIGQAAGVLEISENELRDLIAGGFLKVGSGPQLDGFPDTRLEVGVVQGLYNQIKPRAEPTMESILLVGLAQDLIGHEEVREELKVRNLGFGQWLGAVLNGEVRPFKLRPLLGPEFNGYSLNHFAFRKGQFEQYVKERCPEDEFVGRQQRQRKRFLTWGELREMIELLQRKWERQQRTFTRQGAEVYHAAHLEVVAKAIFERSKGRAG